MEKAQKPSHSECYWIDLKLEAFELRQLERKALCLRHVFSMSVTAVIMMQIA
jgi:hypothetical protein